MAYATTRDLWRLALPPASLFQDQELDPGTWTDLTADGDNTSQGVLDLAAESSPREAASVVIRCMRTGEIDVPGEVNPGDPPLFRISLDGGSTWTRSLEPDAHGRIAYQPGGFTIALANADSLGGGEHSFVATDEWTTTTAPSPAILAHLDSASDEIDAYLRDSYSVPLTSYGALVTRICCELARWSLICHRGWQRLPDMAAYEPKRAWGLLADMADGTIQPTLEEGAGGRWFAELVPALDPLSTEDGGLSI